MSDVGPLGFTPSGGDTTPPVWDTTEGIQTLEETYRGCLRATWNSATDADSPPVRYRIYLRKDSAPNAFGIDSPYFVFSTENLIADIYTEADNQKPIQPNTTYYAIVRAVDNVGNEDSNVVNLSVSPTDSLTFEVIANRVRTRFYEQIEVVESIDVQYDNAPPISKPDNTKWVRFSVKIGKTIQTEIGKLKGYRTPGVAIANIFIPLAQGDQPALELADKIADAFRSKELANVTFETPSILNLGRREGEWQVNVTLPFYADNLY